MPDSKVAPDPAEQLLVFTLCAATVSFRKRAHRARLQPLPSSVMSTLQLEYGAKAFLFETVPGARGV